MREPLNRLRTGADQAMNQQADAKGSKTDKGSPDRWVKLGFLVIAVGIGGFAWWYIRKPQMSGWSTDLDGAFQRGRAENRKIIVYFMNKPPGHNDLWIRDNIIKKSGNRQALKEGKFIKIVVQRSGNLRSDLAKRYKLKKLPALLLLGPDSTELNRREGMIGEVEFRNGFLNCSSVTRP